MKRKFLIILAPVLIGSILLAACQVQIGGTAQHPATATPSGFRPETILGIQGDASTSTSYPGIPWVRLGSPTCSPGNLIIQVLKDPIKSNQNQGIHIMPISCQTRAESLFDM